MLSKRHESTETIVMRINLKSLQSKLWSLNGTWRFPYQYRYQGYEIGVNIDRLGSQCTSSSI